MTRIWFGVMAVALSSLVACKTSNDGSETKDIESVKKVTLVQGTDNQGNYVAFITCGEGFIDKNARKAEFAVPWAKVQSLSYGELETLYCTEPVSGGVVNNPPTDNPPPSNGGGGPSSGDPNYVSLDTARCKTAEDIDLPLITEIKRVYISTQVSDSYDQCVLFGAEFEKMLQKMVVVNKGLIDKKTRVYASTADAFTYDAGANKLTIPYQIKDKVPQFINVATQVLGSGLGIVYFNSTPSLLWRFFVGNYTWQAAKKNCDDLGQGWLLPTQFQLQSVRADLTAAKLKELTSNDSCCTAIAQGSNQFAIYAGDFSQVTAGARSDAYSVCVSILAN